MGDAVDGCGEILARRLELPRMPRQCDLQTPEIVGQGVGHEISQEVDVGAPAVAHHVLTEGEVIAAIASRLGQDLPRER